jgi:cytochrome c
MDMIRHSDAIDDRKFLVGINLVCVKCLLNVYCQLEHALSFVSNMPEGPMATLAKNKIIKLRRFSSSCVLRSALFTMGRTSLQ